MDQSTTWPDPTDADAWLAIDAGVLDGCPPGTVVVALRTMIHIGNTRTANRLAKHINDHITRRLRHMVGWCHPGRGEPMIERAHHELMKALFDPAHADYDDLPVAFGVRVSFRMLDAMRVERRHNARFPSYDGMPGGILQAQAQAKQGAGSATAISVEHLLLRIPDTGKRLAFRLYMDGAQIRAGRNNIADALGVDPKTAKKWIEEAKSILAAHLELEIGA